MIGNHNKKIIQLLLVFIFCNIYFSADAKQICEGIKGGIDFSVNVIPKNINYNLDITQNDLNRLAGKNFGKYKNYRVLGLTSTKQSISANMRGQTSQTFLQSLPMLNPSTQKPSSVSLNHGYEYYPLPLLHH